MDKKKTLPKALGYLRKSTKGERADGRERQEKSISQQKTEINKLVRGRFEIVAWFSDEGVSGWKRGANRPNFQKMLEEAKGHGAEAIVVDNIDRFSRAAVGDVQADANSLRQAGVRWIVTASHGDYDLGAQYDIGEILKFTVAVWSSCEYSRQLSRRVSLARRNAAMEGKRTGGPVPYGLVSDGEGGLKFGSTVHVKIVRWIFDQFVNHHRPACSLARELNKKGTPGPNGKKWYTVTIIAILKRKCYRGDFSYNEQPRGEFFRVDGDGEVVEASEAKGSVKVFSKAKCYKPLVDPKLFDKAQRRLADRSKDRSRRKRQYALSGILKCGACRSPLHGVKLRESIVYRCGSPGRSGTCHHYSVRQDDILPFILQLLREEVDEIMALSAEPPNEIAEPHHSRMDHHAELEQEREKLSAQIETATDNLMLSKDARSRGAMDRALTKMRDRLDELDLQLTTEAPTISFTDVEYDQLEKWYSDFFERAVKMPLGDDPTVELDGVLDATGEVPIDGRYELLDPVAVNEALHELGCEVVLQWKSETRPIRLKSGKRGTRKRHTLSRGRFQLGQQNGKLPKYVVDSTVRR